MGQVHDDLFDIPHSLICLKSGFRAGFWHAFLWWAKAREADCKSCLPKHDVQWALPGVCGFWKSCDRAYISITFPHFTLNLHWAWGESWESKCIFDFYQLLFSLKCFVLHFAGFQWHDCRRRRNGLCGAGCQWQKQHLPRSDFSGVHPLWSTQEGLWQQGKVLLKDNVFCNNDTDHSVSVLLWGCWLFVVLDTCIMTYPF